MQNKIMIYLLLLCLSTIFCFIEIKEVGQDNMASNMGDASMNNLTGTFPPFEKIYIINLKKRLDKRAAMEERLKELQVNIPFEFIEAIDGNKIDKEWLAKNDAAPLISWRDPKIKRPLTKGEIGCMLSHIKAWDMIIESGQPGLILEDDSVFSENFLMRVLDLKDDLTENYWEMFYFYRQQLRDGEKRVGLNLVSPKYSYLTLSYSVTVEGAKKLRNTPIKQNLIPSDEYLSIMFGKSPLRRYTTLYDNYPKVVTLAHLDNDLITPVETSYEDSDTEKSTSVEELFDLPFLHQLNDDSYFVTIGHTNDKKDEGFRFFERSANFYGISPLLVETDEASNDFKIIQAVHNKLKEVHSQVPPKSRLVVLVCLEAERTFFNADPYTISENYFGFKDLDILYAAQEKNPHKINNERVDYYANTIHNWKYLSPNMFLSDFHYLNKLFENFLNQKTQQKVPFVDYAADSFFSNLNRAKLDLTCEMFQTIQKNNEQLDVFPKNSKVTNLITYTNPQVFHWSLSGLSETLKVANMAGAWTLKKNSHPSDPEELKLDEFSAPSSYPSIFFSFHLHYNIPMLEEVVKSITNLKYPFQNIHFWFQINSQTYPLLESKLAPLINKIKNSKGTYELVEASPEINFLEARIESFKAAISSSRDLFFTTCSILTDSKVLTKLVKTGKKVVAPLLTEKRRQYRANVWLNITETGSYAISDFYYKIVYSEYNGLWAVPVVSNTYLLKREILSDLSSSLERRNTQIQIGKLDNLFADVEISKELTKKVIFPRLINQKSFGYYIQDYTSSLTDIYFKKTDTEYWKKKYVVSDSQSQKCSDPSKSRENVPLVNRCNAFTNDFVKDFSIESLSFGNYVDRIETTEIKKKPFRTTL
eukprot:TRINITY_DN4061_c0_g1_i1.p1 TRINITY_DN4061_c0_g1~~TRINITY_DN4061_c0_g1_i1.p1  ORF type:complete len:873 (+),score=234.62 TRINITY_DN4061_c0_g1_i1:58-2676(+)